MFHSIDGIEHRATAIMRGERDLPPWHMDPSLPMTVNSLADAWRRSGTMKELEQLLAGVESGEESELSTRDLYEKLEGAFMDRLIINDNSSARVGLLSPPQTNTPSILEQIAPDIAAENQGTLLAVSNNTPHVPFFEESQETMDLLHNWSHLLDRYFTDTHTWFPIASKHDVLRQAFCLANSGTEAEGQERMMSNGGRAALNATFAYASYRDALSNQDRAGQVESSFTSAEGQRCGSPSVHLTRRLQNEAMSILNDDSKQIEYDDGHVQALLVLTILQIDQGSLQQAWITIGKAVHIAVILKIIPSSHRDTISAVSDKQRRLFLGIYVLETLLAYNLEQRPYLKGVDLAKIGSLPVDGIEEWEAWRPLDRHESTTGRARTPGRSLSVFNTFLNLITLLNDHAHGTYSLDQSLQGFQSWKTALSSAYQNALISIEASSFETPPQMQNLMLASLSIGVVLQVKSCRVQENRQSPASLTAIPASARDALEAIMRHRRRSMPSQSCPLMPIYISMIQSQVDIYGQPHILSDLQQPPEPTNRSTRPTNHGRSLDYLELQTSPRCPSPIQASIANACEFAKPSPLLASTNFGSVR